MKLFKSLSIQSKIVAALLSTAVLSAGVVGYVGYNKSKDMLVDRIQSSDLPNLVQLIRNSIDGEIGGMKTITRVIGSDRNLEEWMDSGRGPEGEKKLTSLLKELNAKYGLSNSSYADRRTGHYYNQDGLLRVLKNDDLDGWFYAFRDGGQEESASTYRYPDGKVDVFVNFQQVNGVGMSGVSKSFDSVIEYLNDFKIEETGFVYLVDASGMIKVHKNEEIADKMTLSEVHTSLNTSKLMSEQAFAFQEVDGKLLASSFIPNLGWYVVAEVPSDEIYASLNDSRDFMIICLLIIAIAVAVLSFILSKSITKPINEMADLFIELGEGEGDLTVSLDDSSSDELGRLAKGFNSFKGKIAAVVVELAETSKYVKESSELVNSHAEEAMLNSTSQKDATMQVATAINQMGATISEIASNASLAATSTTDASQEAGRAHEIVLESTGTINDMAKSMSGVSETMQALAAKSDSITSVLDVIRDISEQTNLLALNAAIEAARAGEQGRGFAVVADEVRKLAQRTSESTDEISNVISELQRESSNAVISVNESQKMAEIGVDSASKTYKALESIVGNVEKIADMSAQIATATEEQSVVVADINVHVNDINDRTEIGSENSERVSKSSDDLKEVASKLDMLVSKFKV